MAPGGSRGKFMGGARPVAASFPARHQQGGINAGAGGVIGVTLSSRVHAAVTRRKAVEERRGRIFRDLDEAEDIVLSLLTCAADAAEALSDMATAENRVAADSDEGRLAKEKRKQSFDELAVRVRANSSGYLVGAKKLHSLLAPHASLVKAYKNHDEEDSKEIPSPNRGVVVGASTSNMYAARVEKRLAMERKEILKEMIRLEESENVAVAVDVEEIKTDDCIPGSKRKRD